MPGLIRGVARTAAIAGTATAVLNRVSRRQAALWDRVAALEDPADLQAAGILSPEEFASGKGRLLAS